MSDLEIIKNRLKEFGFFPEFSNKSKYLAKLKSYLGLKKAEELLDNIDFILENTSDNDKIDTEYEIAKLAIGDPVLINIIYSSGIETSIEIFCEVLNILDNIEIEPHVICDLGGANGWSLQLLDEYFELSSKLILIEQNPTWEVVNPKIVVLNSDYAAVSENLQSELIISIFGSPANNVESLLKCASAIMKKDSLFIVALRIPNNYYFEKFQLIANKYGLGVDFNNSKRLQYYHKNNRFTETFPIFTLSNSIIQKEIYALEQLHLVKS